MDCTLTIKDEVNVSFTGLSPEHRRKLVSSLEFMVPYARHMPSFKLGRWNGKKSFATMGGGTYYNMLDRVLPMIIEAGYNLEVVDKRVPVTFDFPLIDEDYFAHVNWPEGHPMEGQPIKLREHQVRAINLYVQNPQSLQTISTSAGKAQPLYSKIKTPTGWIAMGDAAVGQIVSTPDGGTAAISGVYPQGKKSVYRVHFLDGRSADACEDHLWKVHKATWHKSLCHGNSDWDVISTKEMISLVKKKTNRNRLSIPLVIADGTTPPVDLPIDPYVLGALIGDGSFRNSHIQFSSADKEVIDEVSSRLEMGYLLRHVDRYDYNLTFDPEIYAQIRSTQGRNRNGSWHHYVKTLKNLGLMEKYSHEKFIPEMYKNSSRDQKLALIQGLFDTDGTVGRHGDICYTTSSEKLATDVQEIIRSLGGMASIKAKNTSYTYDGVRKAGKTAYNVKVRHQFPSTLFKLSRKRMRTSDRHRFDLRLAISSIEYIGEIEAQCIMIDHPEHLYITDDFVVTHNTIITAALSKMVEPHGRTLVVVPGKDLVRQTRLDYVNCGLDAGVYFGDEKQTDNKHIIATWQSLTALNNNNPDTLAKILDGCVCVMVDECHTIKGEELRKLLCGTLSDIPLRWGLSGTIQKEDHEFFSLLCSIGPVVGEIRADELMEKGILSNCHIHIQQLIDDVDYKDYETELDYLCTDRRRLEYITKYCENIAKTGNTLVLINRIVMGEEISSKLGVPFINGKVASKKRAEEYRNINYTDNQLIVATFGVASTGINLPRIFNLVLIEPGKSFVRVVQSIGRGLRTAADKDFVNIYDVCSNAKFSKRHLTTRKGFYREANYPFKVEKVSYK